jgi:hypothetical protein
MRQSNDRRLFDRLSANGAPLEDGAVFGDLVIDEFRVDTESEERKDPEADESAGDDDLEVVFRIQLHSQSMPFTVVSSSATVTVPWRWFRFVCKAFPQCLQLPESAPG